jgi:hypothetical protein
MSIAGWENPLVPDWTYQPLRPIAAAVIGQRRTQVLALRLLNTGKYLLPHRYSTPGGWLLPPSAWLTNHGTRR